MNFQNYKKKMIVIPTLFRKLQTVKDLVRPLSKKHRFRTPFDSQHVKWSQTLAKSSREHFHYIFITLGEHALEYTSLSDILGLRVASQHIDCQ